MDESSKRSPTLEAFWPRLLHRWLIQYNPAYLISAALVLLGSIVWAQGVAADAGAAQQLGISAIAEAYGWAAIGGAALLTRIGLRRPAVMLALLAALYQCDLTLLTHRCVYLGPLGVLGSLAWFVGFTAKLYALAWAVRLRLSRAAVAVAVLGAAGVATVPWVLRLWGGDVASVVIAAWLFGFLALGSATSRTVPSRVPLDAWARLVACRSLKSTWFGWAAMAMFHMVFWYSQHTALRPEFLGPVFLLLASRTARAEWGTWAMVGGAIAWTCVDAPDALWLIAALGAVTLGLRALRHRPPPHRVPHAPAASRPSDVYRTEPDAELPIPRTPLTAPFAFASASARRRLLVAAAGCIYVSAWTVGWQGGAWPPHVWWLDATLLLTSAFVVRRWGVKLVLALPALSCIHLVIAARLLPTPQSASQWGITLVSAGFGLLLLGLAASVHWRLRR